MNYLEAVNRTMLNLGETASNSLSDSLVSFKFGAYVEAAYREITTGYNWSWLWADLPIVQTSAATPALFTVLGCSKIKRVKVILDDGSERPVQFVDKTVLGRYPITQAAEPVGGVLNEYPRLVARTAQSTLKFYPYPGLLGTDRVLVEGKARVLPLVNATDTFLFPSEYDDLLVRLACAHAAHRHLDDLQAASRFMQSYTDLLNNLKADDRVPTAGLGMRVDIGGVYVNA